MKKICEKNDRATSVRVYVYDFSKEPRDFSEESFFMRCEKRKKEIVGATDMREKARKFYAWELLDFALKENGVDTEKTIFTKSANGKWGCEKLCFSIAHTGKTAAVAVSEAETGLDIERIDRRVKKGLWNRIATEEEKERFFSPTDEETLVLWTKKESVFKKRGDRIFCPEKINTLEENVKTSVLSELNLIVSVAGEGNFSTEIRIAEKKNGKFCKGGKVFPSVM